MQCICNPGVLVFAYVNVDMWRHWRVECTCQYILRWIKAKPARVSTLTMPCEGNSLSAGVVVSLHHPMMLGDREWKSENRWDYKGGKGYKNTQVHVDF